jgi:hypothetical protein
MTITWIFLKEELIQLIVYNFKRGEFADRISGEMFWRFESYTCVLFQFL